MKFKTKQIPLFSMNMLKAMRMNFRVVLDAYALIIKQFHEQIVLMKLVLIHEWSFGSMKSGYELWKRAWSINLHLVRQ